MSQQLPKDRLATTDVEGYRVYLYPSAVRGIFHDRKRWVHGFLMVLFLVLPWLHLPGDRQLLLLDVAHREFFIFGLHMRAHDAPLLVFVFLGFAFTIGFVTAVWGRIWCGWACPQTVFTEALFRRIEAWIEGGPRERRELDAGPWTSRKFLLKAAKWLAFLAVTLIFTNSFLAYFVGSHEVFHMMIRPPAENWTSFLVVVVSTAILLFDFGWFREQFCVIACPYGRFQSVMLGPQSLVVGYDTGRGEPRRGSVPPGVPVGDCISCMRCVQVCPTGIDIRRGLQMECVACTACADACDEVMAKTKKPLGLIRYMRLADTLGKKGIGFNARAALYGTLALAMAAGLIFNLSRQDFVETAVLRARGAPYELLASPAGELVVNHFHLEISNQTGKEELVRVSLGTAAPAGAELVMPLSPVRLPDGAKSRADFFLKLPRSLLRSSEVSVPITLELSAGPRILEVPFVGPAP